jgi:hypothetical protein
MSLHIQLSNLYLFHSKAATNSMHLFWLLPHSFYNKTPFQKNFLKPCFILNIVKIVIYLFIFLFDSLQAPPLSFLFSLSSLLSFPSPSLSSFQFRLESGEAQRDWCSLLEVFFFFL